MINNEKYRIVVLGTGHIGKTLARGLASALKGQGKLLLH